MINQALKKYFTNNDREAFEAMMAIDGEIYRKTPNRETLKFSIDGTDYFIKKHFGIGFWEIFKELLQGRCPVLSAAHEHNAIKALNTVGIRTAEIAGYDAKGINPAKRRSFILLKSLSNTQSFNDLLLAWHQAKPDFALKIWVIRQLAHIVSCMHQHRFIHRDCYLLHFRIDKQVSTQVPMDLDLPVYLLDLHRSFFKARGLKRWIIKDLASLYFSAKDVWPISDRDCYRFMKFYTGQSLREILTQDENFWRKVKQKGERLLKTACRA